MSHLTFSLAKGQCYIYGCGLFFLFGAKKSHQGVSGGRLKRDRELLLGRTTFPAPQKLALNRRAVHNNAGFVINAGQKTLINHNIHEAPATE